MHRKTYTLEELQGFLRFLCEELRLNETQVEELLIDYERRWLPAEKVA